MSTVLTVFSTDEFLLITRVVDKLLSNYQGNCWIKWRRSWRWPSRDEEKNFWYLNMGNLCMSTWNHIAFYNYPFVFPSWPYRLQMVHSASHFPSKNPQLSAGGQPAVNWLYGAAIIPSLDENDEEWISFLACANPLHGGGGGGGRVVMPTNPPVRLKSL